MGGLLTHLIAGTAGGIVIHLLHQRLEFSMILFLGNLLPDMIKFGFSALVKGTFSILSVKGTETYIFLSKITSDVTNWSTIAFFFSGLSLFLYHYHVIQKKTFQEYEELIGFLILGIITHLLIDWTVIESGPWI